MKTTGKLLPLALALVLGAAVSGACADRGGDGEQSASAAADDREPEGGGSSGGAGLTCPPEAEVAAAVGAQVLSKPYRFGCFYETADAETSVTIMSISPGRAEQVLEEMRSAAQPYGAEVTPVDVGDRGHAWSSPAQSQGVAVEGDRAYMLEVVSTGGGGDRKPGVIRILEMMVD